MLVGISPVGFGLMCLLIGAGLALVAWPIAYAIRQARGNPTVERLLEHNRELTTQIQRLATQQGDNSLVITPPTARHAGTVTRMGTREDEADILKRLMDLLFAPPRRWDSAIDNGVVRYRCWRWTWRWNRESSRSPSGTGSRVSSGATRTCASSSPGCIARHSRAGQPYPPPSSPPPSRTILAHWSVPEDVEGAEQSVAS
jgi:hypothetical protein